MYMRCLYLFLSLYQPGFSFSFPSFFGLSTGYGVNTINDPHLLNPPPPRSPFNSAPSTGLVDNSPSPTPPITNQSPPSPTHNITYQAPSPESPTASSPVRSNTSESDSKRNPTSRTASTPAHGTASGKSPTAPASGKACIAAKP